MRLEKWFISNLDDSQRKIITENIENNLVIKGAAGSGKTNLAIHRARLAKGKGTYAILIFTVALKRMISYGMKVLDLDPERIAYDWAWENRGFDLLGDVYCVKKGNDSVDRDILYLVNDMVIRKFQRSESDGIYGIDFGDWVDRKFYSAFGRRYSWFEEVPLDSNFDISNTSDYELIVSGTIYKKAEDKIDYLIIDEAQDFNVNKYISTIQSKVNVSLSLFGDSAQQLNRIGSNMEEISSALNFNCMSLDYNYRLPKSIARVAQKISDENVDLLSHNLKDGGNSDYPYYPKPEITKFKTEDLELSGIVDKIKTEDLDDVAILVPDETAVKKVNDYLNEKGIHTQVHYRTGSEPPFRTIDTLDFLNNDLPCVLTYYTAKGSEFDNVFVPFANTHNKSRQSAFYVACTRSSRNLYISYTGNRIRYLENVDSNDIVERNMSESLGSKLCSDF